MKIPNRTIWSFSTLAYTVLLTYVSLKPAATTDPSSLVSEILHNFCHIPAYSLLMFFLFATLGAYRLHKNSYAAASLVAFAFGILMEYLQSFAPGRTPSLMDVGLNATGITVMIVLLKKGYFQKWI